MNNSFTKQALLFISSIALTSLVELPRAAAQSSSVAATLFQQGIAAMKSGQYDDAITAFEGSENADPQLGTLFYLAICEEKAGRYASAVSHFEEYTAKFGRLSAREQNQQRTADPDYDRPATAEKTITDVSPLRAHLKISLTASAPSGTVVLLDEIELVSAALNQEFHVNPGLHKLTVRTPDGTVGTPKSITLDKGQSESFELDIPTKPIVELKKPHVEGPDKQVPFPPETLKGQQPSPMRTAAFVVGGVGVVGLGLGVVMGALVANKAGFIAAHCPNATCDNEGFEAHGNAKTYGTVSEVGFGVGAVGLGLGTLFFVLSKPLKKATSASIALDVGPWGTNGLMGRVEGRW